MTLLAAPTTGLWLAVFDFARHAVVAQLVQFLFDDSPLLKQERDGLLAQFFNLIYDAHKFVAL